MIRAALLLAPWLLVGGLARAAEPLEFEVEKAQVELGEATTLTLKIDAVADAPRHTVGNPSTVGEERYLPGDEPILHFRMSRDGTDYADNAGQLATVGTPVHGSWFFPHLRVYPQFDGTEWRVRTSVELTYTATAGMPPGEVVVIVDGGQGGGPSGPQSTSYRASAKIVVGPTDIAAEAPIGVGLACDTRALDAGGVACNASVTGGGPFGRLRYTWTLDGGARDETDESLVAGGLAVGPHTVTVRVTDEDRKKTSSIESVSFTRAASGTDATATSETPPPLGQTGGPNTILVGGAAVAIAGAIAALLRRRLRPRPDAAAAPGTAPKPKPAGLPEQRAHPPAPPRPVKPPEALPPRPRPATLPEHGRKEDKPQEQPQILVQLRVTPSIRTQQRHGIDDIHLWGDGIDLVLVGYSIQVLTPGWKLDTRRPRDDAWDPGKFEQDGVRTDSIRVTAGAAKRVWAFERFGAGSVYHAPLTSRQWVVQADWLDAGQRELEITVDVQAWVVGGSGEPVECGATARRTVQVIGASPRVTLQAIDAALDADGSARTRVEPVLELFDTIYAGGLAFVPGSIPDRATLERYFEFAPERFRVTVNGSEIDDPHAARRNQGLALRARFHLEDGDLERVRDGVEVRFSVQPTGVGAGEESTRSAFDWMAGDHYKACALHLRALAPKTPARVRLRASKIEFEQPPALPHLRAPGSEPDATVDAANYTNELRARVVSASGAPVKGSTIKNDRPSGMGGIVTAIDTWKLQFFYDSPPRDPLKAWDRKAAGSRAVGDERFPTAGVHDVGENGALQFESPLAPGTLIDYCVYNHWKEYYNTRERYLGGQCCTLNVSIVADGKEFIGTRFTVGPPSKLYFYVDFREDSIVGHVFIGLIDERGCELRAGCYPHLAIDGLFPFQAQSAVGAVALGVVGGAAGLALGQFFGAALVAGKVLVGVRALSTAAGFLGAARVGAAAGTTGVGKLDDEGQYLVPGTSDRTAHRFDVCRGWDISRAGYDRLLQRLKVWKRESDLGHLWYDVTASSKTEFSGNCVTFVRDICSHAGVVLPFPTDAVLERPGNFGPALEADPRHEANKTPDDGASYAHPWTWPEQHILVVMENLLGRTIPPSEPGPGEVVIQMLNPGAGL